MFDGTGMIFISPNSNETIPATINLGMHEVTHMLPYLSGKSRDSLSELATFYTQYNYGLPVHAKDVDSFAEGVRDVRRAQQLRPDLNLLYEYNYFIVGEILNPFIRPADILSFSKEDANGSVIEACFDLIAIKEKRFFMLPTTPSGRPEMTSSAKILPSMLPSFMEKLHFTQEDVDLWNANPDTDFYLGQFKWDKVPVQIMTTKFGNKLHLLARRKKDGLYVISGYVPCNQKEYLERLFGKNAAAVAGFYNRLAAKLPAEFVQEVKEMFPVLTTDTFMLSKTARQQRKELSQKYKAVLEQAVVEALEESGAAPAPAIPKGYL